MLTLLRFDSQKGARNRSLYRKKLMLLVIDRIS